MPTNSTTQSSGTKQSSTSRTSRAAGGASAGERPDTATKTGRSASAASAGSAAGAASAAGNRAEIPDQQRARQAGSAPAGSAQAGSASPGRAQMGSQQAGSASPGSRPGAATTSGATPRADRERELGLSREQARAAAPRAGAPFTATQSSATYASPFAFMRRFGEDMDRLFEEFGFAPLGLDPFALLSPSLGYALAAPEPDAAERTSAPGAPARQVATRARGGAMAPSGSWMPQVEVTTRNDALVVRADLPGVKREDVRIDLHDDRLTLSGSRHQESEERGEGFYHSERSYGSFSRVIPLPKGIDADACQAKYQDGVLEITIPMPARASGAKRIEIR